MLLLTSGIVFTCMHKLIASCQNVSCTWQRSGTVSVPVGAHMFQAVIQACLFSQCGSAHRFLVLSSVGTPPSQPRQQSTHTGRATQWAVWESEAETDEGGEGEREREGEI